MSELGQNEGQEQGKDAPFFDSSKITDKKDVEHFANVEGAEERARKAEQAKKAAEKEAQEVHAADIRAASEQLKKQENAETPRKRGGVIGFLFGGWHKIVTIVVLLALLVGGVYLAINTFYSEPYSEKVEKDKVALEAASKVEDDARTVFDINSNEETYKEAKDIYEKAIGEADDREAVFLKIMYADFIYENTSDFDLAVSVLDGIEKKIDTEVAANYYNYRIGDIYYDAGAEDAFEEIVMEAE